MALLARRKPRDLQAKSPCAVCNNGWMNDMDNELIVLGPQLVKGKAVRLTKTRQASLAAWAVRLILMLQQVYPRDSRFVIPETDYTQFYADRQPSKLMRLWAGELHGTTWPARRRHPSLRRAQA